MFYGSSYELRLCCILDEDESIETFETQISYLCEERGRCLDFMITYKNGRKKAIEVKPFDRLKEPEFVKQLDDSKNHALSQGWDFEIVTEKELGMSCKEIRNWADEYRKTLTGINYKNLRLKLNSEKSRRYYDKHIRDKKITFFCHFCKEEHQVLALSYTNNINRNGRYICESEGGYISGKKPKNKKINPYLAEGKKQCTNCKEIKLLENFNNDKSRSDGLSNICQPCNRMKCTQRYEKNKD